SSVWHFIMYSEEYVFNPILFFGIPITILSISITVDFFSLKAIEVSSETIKFIYNHKTTTVPIDKLTFWQEPTEGISSESYLVIDGPGKFRESITAGNWIGYVRLRNHLIPNYRKG
ncbi:MAG: hypothetical protein AAFP70_04855, partial [Calditrichota bacterium]